MLFTSVHVADAGLKIYYIRHAEGGHNVKKHWVAKGIPESEWPEYVGDPNVFSPKGLEQVASATEALQQYDFDFIASSPVWRARNTILPYLKVTKHTAEVWPELKEGAGTSLTAKLPKVEEEILNKGEAIEIPEDEAEFFKLRKGGENDYKKARAGGKPMKLAYMRYVTLHAIEMIESRFGGTEKSILLAGHKSAGLTLLRFLLKEKAAGMKLDGFENAGIWMVEQQEDGSYELMMYNNQPYQK